MVNRRTRRSVTPARTPHCTSRQRDRPRRHHNSSWWPDAARACCVLLIVGYTVMGPMMGWPPLPH